jgi:hypothetical protein
MSPSFYSSSTIFNVFIDMYIYWSIMLTLIIRIKSQQYLSILDLCLHENFITNGNLLLIYLTIIIIVIVKFKIIENWKKIKIFSSHSNRSLQYIWESHYFDDETLTQTPNQMLTTIQSLNFIFEKRIYTDFVWGNDNLFSLIPWMNFHLFVDDMLGQQIHVVCLKTELKSHFSLYFFFLLCFIFQILSLSFVSFSLTLEVNIWMKEIIYFS